MVEVRGIRKVFGGTVAVDDVSLHVAAGEVCALVGQNGAGKSTLMSILSGALRPDAGEMSLGGVPYRPASPLDARKAGVAMIYQELSLAPHLSVAENMLLGVEPTRHGLLKWDAMRATTAGVLERLGHPDIDPNAPVSSLSVAEQQLVEIGRALAVGCKVIVLDEPTSSLGRSDVLRLFELIRQLKAQQHAIIYISHFLEEIKEIADRIVVLRDGRVAGTGAASELALSSNPHPHCQIWANAEVPGIPQKEHDAQRNWKASKGGCLLCDYLAVEREARERIVWTNATCTAVVPYWAVWPYEVLLMPNRHVTGLDQLDSRERDGLGEAVQNVVRRYDRLFEAECPYSMGFHQRPTDGAAHEAWHLHAHYYPPVLRSAAVHKFMVGYELLATPQRDLTPELAAAALREAL